MFLYGLVISFFVGFMAGALSGDEKTRFFIFGRMFRKMLLRKPLISAKPVCCKNYICKDGLVSIHGLKIKNKTPLIYLSDCWVILHKTFASWVLHWQAQYDEKFSKCNIGGKREYCNETVNELIDEYAHRLSKYSRYPKSNISLSQYSGRIIEVLVEINKWNSLEAPSESLKEIVESGKGEYHLAIAEAEDPQCKPNLTPVMVKEGWKGSVAVNSDKFGPIGVIQIEIPIKPEKYVDWDSGYVIPKEQEKERGQPLRLKIKRIY